MKVLITGATGFVARNFRNRLSERPDIECLLFERKHDQADLVAMLDQADIVFHLAGVNRPQDPAEFVEGNSDLSRRIAGHLGKLAERTGRKVPIIFASSTQAQHNNPYGESKRAAEDAFREVAASHGVPAFIFRFPNIFGKWCRPNYNSAVATFCHNAARELPIQINDPDAPLTLIYVDDVVEQFLAIIDGSSPALDDAGFCIPAPVYTTNVGTVAHMIKKFCEARRTMMTGRVGTDLERALYATYISYLPTDDFIYSVPMHVDARGAFVEMLKTPDCGQFSYFTAHPGVTRGGHYHHTKVEKFLLITGAARFRFRNMDTDEQHELIVEGGSGQIVESIPGWSHDVTNIGDTEMAVMLWANEIFDPARPDTYARPL